MNAKEYFKKEYDEKHVLSVVESKDLVSLYGLIEEYAELKCKEQREICGREFMEAKEEMTKKGVDNSGYCFTRIVNARLPE